MRFFSWGFLSRSVFVIGVMLGSTACGSRVIPPLQSNTSPIETPTSAATSAALNSPPTVTPNLIATAAASSASAQVTPSTKSTSDAVLATVTALASTPTKAATNTPRPNRTPISAGPNDPPTANAIETNGIRIESFSSQVFRGGAATVSIRTKAGSQCGLYALRNRNGTTQVEPLAGVPSRIAGTDGGLAWIWTVSTGEATGKLILEVQCGDTAPARFELRIES